MSRRQKRELGILPRQVLQRLRTLAKDGEICSGMGAEEIALVLVMDLASEDCCEAAWDGVMEGTFGADWDAILEFLTKLIELIIRVLPLFI